MRIRISQVPLILEGWGNRIKDEFHILDPKIKELASERLLKCNECDIREGNTCHPERCGIHMKTGKLQCGCGCNIAAKTLSPSSECPLGKWDKQ